jgi:phosphoglycolate phosphatase
MEMALNAGVGAIGVGWGYHAGERLIDAGARLVVNEGSGLLEAIERQLAGQSETAP